MKFDQSGCDLPSWLAIPLIEPGAENMRSLVSKTNVTALAAMALTTMVVLVAMTGNARGSETAKFTAASYYSVISGLDKGTHEFTAAGGAHNCKHKTFGSLINEATPTMTMQVEETECTSYGFVGSTVTMNGCDYLYHLNGTFGTAYKGTVDIVCPAGKEITIDAGPCLIHIPGQTGLGPVTFTNGTSDGKGDITLHSNVSGIKGSLTRINFLCFFAEGPFTNGTTTGTVTLTGKNGDGFPHSIDIG